MDTSPRQDQQTTAQRRMELLDAANRVVLREGPEASMNAIAAEAGITKPILYRHFGDKGGLYRALAKRHTDAMLEACWIAIDSVRDRRGRVEATMDAYLSAIEDHPQVYRFLMHPAEDDGDTDRQFDIGRHVSPLLRRLGEELATALSERMELGEESDLVARIWGHGIVGMMYAAGDWWLAERPCSKQELIKHLADLLWARLTEVPDKKRSHSTTDPGYQPSV